MKLIIIWGITYNTVTGFPEMECKDIYVFDFTDADQREEWRRMAQNMRLNPALQMDVLPIPA